MMERIGETRPLSPVASLRPAIIEWRESATVVSTDMSTPGEAQWSGWGGAGAGAGAGAGRAGAALRDEQARRSFSGGQMGRVGLGRVGSGVGEVGWPPPSGKVRGRFFPQLRYRCGQARCTAQSGCRPRRRSA